MAETRIGRTRIGRTRIGQIRIVLIQNDKIESGMLLSISGIWFWVKLFSVFEMK
jgi:hypothetical protein